MMTTYTIDRVTSKKLQNDKEFYEKFIHYVGNVGPAMTELFDNQLNWQNADIRKMVEDYCFLVCIRKGEITGHMICQVCTTPLDPTVKIMQQLSFYVKPDSGRSAYYLFQKFIDIGKTHANHIITMLARQTNIKPSTLESMGFEEVEKTYRMVIK